MVAVEQQTLTSHLSKPWQKSCNVEKSLYRFLEDPPVDQLKSDLRAWSAFRSS